MASGSGPILSEEQAASAAASRGRSRFILTGNIPSITAARKAYPPGVAGGLLGPQGVALVDAARVPQHPRRDAELLHSADLLADLERRVARQPPAERDRKSTRLNSSH